MGRSRLVPGQSCPVLEQCGEKPGTGSQLSFRRDAIARYFLGHRGRHTPSLSELYRRNPALPACPPDGLGMPTDIFSEHMQGQKHLHRIGGRNRLGIELLGFNV